MTKKEKLFLTQSRKGFKRLSFGKSKYNILVTQKEIDEYNKFIVSPSRRREIESIGLKRYRKKYSQHALSKK